MVTRSFHKFKLPAGLSVDKVFPPEKFFEKDGSFYCRVKELCDITNRRVGLPIFGPRKEKCCGKVFEVCHVCKFESGSWCYSLDTGDPGHPLSFRPEWLSDDYGLEARNSAMNMPSISISLDKIFPVGD